MTKIELRGDWSAYMLEPGAMARLADLRRLSRFYGLRVSRVIRRHHWRGDGVIRLEGDEDNELVSNGFHELGHWIVARHKALVNFGLGGSSGDWVGVDRSEISGSFEQRMREEHRASMMGAILERAAGGSALYTLQEHSWLDYRWMHDSSFWSASPYDKPLGKIKWLFDNNMIDGQMRPTGLVI